MTFKWHSSTPPCLGDHSKAKLDVFRSYIQKYYDRLGRAFMRDRFRLDIVDGFAGGGRFSYGGQTISGTPLILLEEEERAKRRLSAARQKQLTFDVHHYFVDSDSQHIEYLKTVLAELGYLGRIGGDIDLINRKFEDVADDLISSIAGRQPRAGRAIFLLDQCGYSRVSLRLVHKIFRRLQNAEVILTFAADSLINFLRNSPEFFRSLLPLGFTEDQLRDIVHWRKNHKAVTQRVLRDHVRRECGALYDTPFFIRPLTSRRALWFIHLSQHPIARDVMIQCHWAHGNTFLHYGTGGFDFMGWDPVLERDTRNLFRFGDTEQSHLKKDLLLKLPTELSSLIGDKSISVRNLRRQFANRTAATYSLLDQVLTDLYRLRVIRISDAQGKDRDKSVLHLRPDDIICIPTQLWLPTNGPMYN